MLKRAVNDCLGESLYIFEKNPATARILRRRTIREGRDWVRSDSEVEWGFIWCCGQVATDYEQIRGLIVRKLIEIGGEPHEIWNAGNDQLV
jgi:hypothetical protein